MCVCFLSLDSCHPPPNIPPPRNNEGHATLKRGVLKVAHFNAHSLINKCDEVKDIISSEKIDIMFIQESWLGLAINSSMVSIRGYDLIRRDRPQQDGRQLNHGGVCAYVRKTLNVKRMYELERDAHECMWLEVSSGPSKVLLCSFYKAPSRDDIEAVDYLESIVSTIGGREIVILGDLNMNMMNEFNPHVDALNTFFTIYGFSQHIREPTHVYNGPTGQEAGSIIDILCTNKPNRVAATKVIDYDPGLLDYHKPISVDYLISLPPLQKYKHYKRNFSEANTQYFLREVGKVRWNHDNVEDAVNFFNLTLTALVALCFPMCEYATTDKSLPNITPEILREKAEKKKLRKIKRRRESTDQDRVNYNRQCDRVRALSKAHRIKCFEQEVEDNLSTSRKLWQIMRYYLPISKTKHAAPEYLSHDGAQITSDTAKADHFNDFFVNIGYNLAQRIPATNLDPMDTVPNPRDGRTFVLHPVTEAEVLKEAKLISESKSTSDPLPFRVLKKAIVFLIIPITIIINLSFAAALVPAALKHAVVTCIYKDGPRDNVSNYRPISVLSLAGKLMEAIVCKRLTRFLSAKGITYKYQSAYRKDHSCEMALNETLSSIYRELEEGRECVVVFLDLRKAFDTIDRTILFSKLERYGIRGHSLEWFKSLLTDRTQSVKMNDHVSAPRNINVGIPQGSALGPLLFSLYINDIYKACDLPRTLLFADDTALVFTGDISSQTINRSLDRFHKWLRTNKLTLNCEKTKYMRFTNKRPENRTVLDVQMSGITLEQVASIKYLGVTIDDQLTFGEHIKKSAANLNHLHGIFSQNKSFISTTVGEKLITALAIPRLMYCSTVFHRSAGSHLLKLDVIYRKLIRIVYRMDFQSTHTAEIYHNTKFIPLYLLRQIQCACFAMRCLSGRCASYLIDRIRLADEYGRRRREPRAVAAPVETFIVEPWRLQSSLQNFEYWAPLVLNSVPLHLIEDALARNHPPKYFGMKYKEYIKNEFNNCTWDVSRETSRNVQYFLDRNDGR